MGTETKDVTLVGCGSIVPGHMALCKKQTMIFILVSKLTWIWNALAYIVVAPQLLKVAH